jgi:hypothetical protein
MPDSKVEVVASLSVTKRPLLSASIAEQQLSIWLRWIDPQSPRSALIL